MSIARALEDVKARIAAACSRVDRSPSEVTLVAVSKRQPDELLLEAYAAGQRDFGENFVQELERKQPLLPPDARWHLIGHVQSNKAKRAATAAVVHTIDNIKIVRRLAEAREGAPLEVLVQVNTEGEVSKFGVSPADAADVLQAAIDVPGITPIGLMGIPPVDIHRRAFVALRALRDDLQARLGVALPALSMGMSGDFEIAIEEGATIVRVGTAVFGAREAP